MIETLVLVADYPNNEGGVALMYVHVRNKYYIQHEINVTVLNFNTSNDYEIDGIKVISLKSYENANKAYDVLVSHAANLRNHYFFLKKYQKRFAHLIFFFHGHEVVKINEVYPKPYNYVAQNSLISRAVQHIYDNLKLTVWHQYFPKIAHKSDFVFVSNCFYNEVKKYLRLSDVDFANHVYIINNCVGKAFEENKYSYSVEKEYDFITIRSRIDESTYCVDLLCQLAERHPQYSFLLIGRGEFFYHYKKPKNLVWINAALNHGELLRYINCSRYALMLTRRDTQGVMSCELATYGIPLITSDLPVCREIFGEGNCVTYVKNDSINSVDLSALTASLGTRQKKECFHFDCLHTIDLEISLIKQ